MGDEERLRQVLKGKKENFDKLLPNVVSRASEPVSDGGECSDLSANKGDRRSYVSYVNVLNQQHKQLTSHRSLPQLQQEGNATVGSVRSRSSFNSRVTIPYITVNRQRSPSISSDEESRQLIRPEITATIETTQQQQTPLQGKHNHTPKMLLSLHVVR